MTSPRPPPHSPPRHIVANEHNQAEPTGRGAGYMLVGSGAANVADGVLQTVFPLLAVAVSDRPSAAPAATAALSLAWLLFSLPWGLALDRYDRPRSLRLGYASRAVILGLLLAGHLAGWLSLPAVVVGALALGVFEVLSDLAAQTLVPDVEEPGRVELTNGRMAAVQLAGNRLAGPALAGLLLLAGSGAALATATVLFATAGLATIRIRARPSHPATPQEAPGVEPSETSAAASPPPESLRAQLRAVQQIMRGRLLGGLAVGVCSLNLSSGLSLGVFVPFALAQDGLDLSPSAYAAIVAVGGLAGITGATLARRITGRLGRGRALVVAFVVVAVWPIVPALTTNPATVIGAFVLVGLMAPVFGIASITMRQRLVGSARLGTVNGAFQLLGLGAFPIGAVAAGLIAETWNVEASFLVAAAVGLAGLLGVSQAAERAGSLELDATPA